MTIESVKLNENKYEAADIAADAVDQVICRYIHFIAEIPKALYRNLYGEENSEAVELAESRKFTAIKKELYNFLSVHKDLYELNKLVIELDNGSVLYERDISILDNGEDFLSKDDALIISELSSADTYIVLDRTYKHSKIIEVLKDKIGKSAITVKDIEQFVEINYLFDNKNFDIKKSNYKDLIAYIEQRIIDYCSAKISTENINEMSFRYQGFKNELGDVESCPLCLEDYKIDQEVCRLPCNHLCCRVCTEKMFSTPILDNPEEYGYIDSCPICRDNCA